MEQEQDQDVTDFLNTQASEAVFLFNRIYAGISLTVEDRAAAINVATQLTQTVIKNVAVIATAED